MEIEELWESLRESVRKICPDAENNLNSAASMYDIELLQKEIGLPIPEEISRIYLINNGQNSKIGSGLIFGMRLLEIKEIIKFIKEIRDFHFNNDLASEDVNISIPDGFVKMANTNPNWIPVLSDGIGAYIAVDLNPDIKGEIGQLIMFGGNRGSNYLVSENLYKFLNWYHRQLEKNNFKIIEMNFKQLTMENPRVLYFTDALPFFRKNRSLPLE